MIWLPEKGRIKTFSPSRLKELKEKSLDSNKEKHNAGKWKKWHGIDLVVGHMCVRKTGTIIFLTSNPVSDLYMNLKHDRNRKKLMLLSSNYLASTMLFWKDSCFALTETNSVILQRWMQQNYTLGRGKFSFVAVKSYPRNLTTWNLPFSTVWRKIWKEQFQQVYLVKQYQMAVWDSPYTLVMNECSQLRMC